MTESILEGVRIVELASNLAGPAAGLMLAECGADVVKVEPPSGDPARKTSGFATWNRSKRSIVLDLKEPSARKKLDELLSEADILLHDYPPSKASEIGLDDDTLERQFPQLISCSVLGYPKGHRDADRPWSELLVQARTGVMGETRGFRDGPIAIRKPMGSWAATHFAVAGILTRLISRMDTGRGGSVHTSLTQGLLSVLSLLWNKPEPMGEDHYLHTIAADRENSLRNQMYQCKDGVWLQLMNPGNRIDLTDMPLTRSVMAEIGAEGPLDVDLLTVIFMARDSEEWLPELRAADVAVEPVISLGEVLRHPEAEANHYVVDVEDREFGKTRQAATPLLLDPPVQVRGPAPRLNEHQDSPWANARAPYNCEARSGAETKSEKPYPLSDLKVIDFGAFLAGPMAPSVLGDMGADVIKVEPLHGDRMRFMTPFFDACSRNKRSIAVDLMQPKGQEILKRLAQWADIAHHNVRMKATLKLGIDEASLHRLNPELIIGYAGAYGLLGERFNWPGYDTIFQAIAGWIKENAGEGNETFNSGFGSLDVLCALNSLVGTLAALYHYRRTGQASMTASSLLGVACLTQSETFMQEDGSLAPYAHLDSQQTGVSPFHRIYQAEDGWVAVAALEEGQPDALCTAWGAEKPGDLEACARINSCSDLLQKTENAGIPAELVHTGGVEEFIGDEANVEAKLAHRVPNSIHGVLMQPGAYMLFGDSAPRFEYSSPKLGEHTRDILGELGYSNSEIDALHQQQVIAFPED